MPSISLGPIILVRVLLVHGCVHGKPVFLERQHKLKKQLPSMHGGGALCEPVERIEQQFCHTWRVLVHGARCPSHRNRTVEGPSEIGRGVDEADFVVVGERNADPFSRWRRWRLMPEDESVLVPCLFANIRRKDHHPPCTVQRGEKIAHEAPSKDT